MRVRSRQAVAQAQRNSSRVACSGGQCIATVLVSKPHTVLQVHACVMERPILNEPLVTSRETALPSGVRRLRCPCKLHCTRHNKVTLSNWRPSLECPGCLKVRGGIGALPYPIGGGIWRSSSCMHLRKFTGRAGPGAPRLRAQVQTQSQSLVVPKLILQSLTRERERWLHALQASAGAFRASRPCSSSYVSGGAGRTHVTRATGILVLAVVKS